MSVTVPAVSADLALLLVLRGMILLALVVGIPSGAWAAVRVLGGFGLDRLSRLGLTVAAAAVAVALLAAWAR